jgi:hypothetical protein
VNAWLTAPHPALNRATPQELVDAGERGVIERVTITVPSDLVRALEELVLEKWRQVWAYNRITLIREATLAFLESALRDA